MEDSCDLILSYWWIIEHKAKGFADGGKISFESKEYKRTSQDITAIHSPMKLMIRYGILGMILDGLESLEILKSMIRTNWI
jgi:hypothetical protein